MNFLIVLIAVLVLVIVGLILRTINMLDVFGGSTRGKVGMSNKINAILFPVMLVSFFVLIWWSYSMASKEFLPEASSVHGKRIDFSFWLTMVVMVAAFAITHVLLFWFPFKYQFRANRRAYFYPDNNRLEVLWTVVPAIVLASLIFSGYRVWADVTADAPREAYTVEIVGKQFAWMIRYPGKDGELGRHNFRKIDATNEVGIDFVDKAAFDDFMSNEIHLPKGKPVVLKIRARDVLHSVFMPHFRVKMDAVPGMPTRFWFIPDKTTQEMRDELNNPNFNYELACTEICGRNHFGMRKVIVVVEEDEYLQWLNSQQSFLARNPEYIREVPDNLKRLATLQMAEGSTGDPSTQSDRTEPAAL